MPEGHVIHGLANQLTDQFVGRPVAVTSPQGRFAPQARQLDGRILTRVEAQGKQLFLVFDDDIVHIHLGLIGKFRPAPIGEVINPETLRLRLANGVTAYDLRGPQWCRLLAAVEYQQLEFGPDPLRADADPDPDIGWQRVRKSSRPIADLLLDQRIAAGVGNIYRSEVLFRQRIYPFAPGRAVSIRLWQSLWTDLAHLMALGVETGRIDTVRPQHDPVAQNRPPRDDVHGGEVYVYRRAGAPCLICHRVVKSASLNNRNLFWCDSCQRRLRKAIQ